MTSTLLLAGSVIDLERVVRATVVIGAAWASAALLQRAGASAAARHLAWLLGIVALLALPLLRWLVPELQLPILPSDAAAAGPGGSAPQQSVPASQDWPAPGGWSGVVLVAYLLGAATLLLRIATGRQMLARLWRQAQPAQDPAWEELLSRLSLEVRLTRPIQLRIARGSAMPMTWGTLAPKVLLPAEASEWTPERRRLVLLHELAHVARRDSLSRSIAAFACAVYWFHPGAWFAARRMRLEQEHAADDRVLAAGGSARTYALSLLHLASRVEHGLRPDLAATMAGTCQLERRLVSITHPARRDRPTAVFLCSSALIASSATLIAAAGVPVSAAPTLPVSLRAERDVIAAPNRGVPARAEDRLSTRADRLFSSSNADEFERPGREEIVAPKPRVETRASGAGTSAEEGPQGVLRSAGDVRSPASGLAQAPAQQLPEYGWELRRRDPQVEIEPSADRFRAAPRSSPGRAATAKERTSVSKWARLVPVLVLPGASSRSSPAPTETRAMLSLSMDVGAQ